MTGEHEPETRWDVGEPPDYLGLFRRHWGLMAAVFLLAVFTVAVWTFRQVPIYSAAATVMIEPEAPKILNIQEVAPVGAVSPWDPAYLPTQLDVMVSEAVRAKALAILNGASAGPGAQAASFGSLPGAVSVQPKRNTRLVFVEVEHPDPALAARVANAVATAYVRHNLELKLKGAQDALVWLQEEAERLRKKAEVSGAAIQNYRIKAGMLGVQEQRQITAAKIMDFNKAYLEAQAQRMSVEAKLRELTQVARDRSGAQSMFIVADNPMIQKTKSDVADLEAERAKLLKTYKESHPEIIKIDARIQQLGKQFEDAIQNMLRAVQTELKVAKAREESLFVKVKSLTGEGQDLTEKEAQYQNLQREHESNQALYEVVIKRMKETGVTGQLETNNVRVLEEARPPGSPVRPRKAWNLMMSAVAGLVLGVGLAFVVDRLDVSVKTPTDVERHGLPVIAIVPRFSRRA